MMSDLQVFSIFDSKAQAYMQPFFMPTKGMAVRAFDNLANDINSEICRHPEDFTLFHLGVFVPDTGHIGLHGAPVSLGVAVQFKRELPLLPLEEAINEKSAVSN